MHKAKIPLIIKAAKEAARVDARERYTTFKLYYTKNILGIKEFYVNLIYFIIKEELKKEPESLDARITKVLEQYRDDQEFRKETLTRFILYRSRKKWSKAKETIKNIRNLLSTDNNFIVFQKEGTDVLQRICFDDQTIWRA